MEPPSSPDDNQLSEERPTETQPPSRSALSIAVPAAILILALALRMWGLTWGLPNERHVLSYHPDEGVNLVSGVLDEGQLRPHLDIKFYHYGSLYFYAWQVGVALNRSYGVIKYPVTGQPNSPVSDSPAAMIFVGRLLSAFFGVGTVALLIALGTRLFRRELGWCAGLLFAVIPAAVLHGHYATVDSAATFFVTLALLVSAKLFQQTTPKALLLAGFCCGLAGAAKYNAILVFAAPMMILLSKRPFELPRIAREKTIMVAGVLIGFLIACPGVFLNFDGFKKDFLFELNKSREGMGTLFVDTGNGWVYTLSTSFRYGLGIPLLLAFLMAIVWSFLRRDSKKGYLLGFFIPYFLVIGASQVRFLRYIVPVLPVVALLVPVAIFEIAEQFRAHRISPAVLAALCGWTLINSVSLNSTLVTPDPRDMAMDYMQKEGLLGKSVGFVTTPWYYTPPLDPLFTAPSPAVRKKSALERQSIHFILSDGEWDAAVLGQRPDVYLVSDIESDDAIRIGLPATKPFIKAWETDYKVVKFEKTPQALGIDFGKPQYLPNDWLYTFPTIKVYIKK